MGKKRRIKLRREAKNKRTRVEMAGIIKKVALPDDEKTIIKEVPAKAGDVVVGTAVIYDDGSVDVIFDKDADPEAVELIKKIEGDIGHFGYTAETE